MNANTIIAAINQQSMTSRGGNRQAVKPVNFATGQLRYQSGGSIDHFPNDQQPNIYDSFSGGSNGSSKQQKQNALAGGGFKRDPQNYQIVRGEMWSRNNGRGGPLLTAGGSQERQSFSNQGSYQQSTEIQGIQGTGYPNQSGKFQTNYQKILQEKHKHQLENQAKVMYQLEREKDLLLDGLHLNLTQGKNPSSQSPNRFKSSTNCIPPAIDDSNNSQFRVTQQKFQVNDPSTLVEGIIISKINVQPASLTHRKTHHHQYDLKSRKAQVGFKFYQTLAGTFGNGNLNASPTPNMDLECLIKQDQVKQKKGNKQDSIQEEREMNEIMKTAISLEKIMTDSKRASREEKERRASMVKTGSTPKASGNLKYHVIRQLLEKANPSEVREFMQSQQRKIHNATGKSNHSEDFVEERSSKENPNQGSLLLGESLLMENSVNSSLKKRKLDSQGGPQSGINRKLHGDNGIQTNHPSLDDLISQQMAFKNALQSKGSQDKFEPASRQKFQIKISSNSRERSPGDQKALRSESRNIKLQQNRSKSRQNQIKIVGGGGGPILTTNSGYAINQLQQNSSKFLKPNEDIQRWGDTLCVQIRQLPMYSKDGTAIPLQHFASTEFNSKLRVKKTQDFNKTQSQFRQSNLFQSQNASKLNNQHESSGSKRQFIQSSAENIGASRFSNNRDFRFRTSRQNNAQMNKDYIKNQVIGLSIEQQRQSLQVASTIEFTKRAVAGTGASAQQIVQYLEQELVLNACGTPEGSSSHQRTIRVPQIEFQQDMNRKMGNNYGLTIKKSPIGKGGDTSPKGLRSQYRRQSEKPIVPQQIVPFQHNSTQNHISINSSINVVRKNSQVVQASINSNTISQNQFSSQNELGLPSIEQQQTLNQTSGAAFNQNCTLQMLAPYFQSQPSLHEASTNPAVLVINNSQSALQQPSGALINDKNSHNITVTIGGQRLSLDGNYESISTKQSVPLGKYPPTIMEGHSVIDELSVSQTASNSISEPKKSLIKKSVKKGGEDELNMMHGSNLHVDDSRIGPLYSKNNEGLPTIINKFKKLQREVQLPNLHKKYMVGLQQQLYSGSEEQSLKLKQEKEKEQRIKDAKLRTHMDQEMRATKQTAIFNSFERLSKHMKQRNQLRMLGTMGPGGFGAEKSRFGKDSLMFSGSSDPIQMDDIARSTHNWNTNQSVYINQSLYNNNIDHKQSMNMESTISPRFNKSTKYDPQAPGPENQFFKALQKHHTQFIGLRMMSEDSQSQDQTKLMRKTQHQMQMANLTTSDKLKTKCMMVKNICPFEIIKNGIPIHIQQLQLSRILKVQPTEQLEQVPYLKQTCLVEYLKDMWPNILNNPKSMKDYQFFSLFYPQRRSYNLIIFGNDTPVSKCCQQLVVFQFGLPRTDLNSDSSVQFDNMTSPGDFSATLAQNYGTGSLKVYCSDPQCSETPLQESVISSKQFIESILNTPNGMSLQPPLLAFSGPQMVIDQTFYSPENQQQNKSILGSEINRNSYILRTARQKDTQDSLNHPLGTEEDHETLGGDEFNYDSQQYLRPGSKAFIEGSFGNSPSNLVQRQTKNLKSLNSSQRGSESKEYKTHRFPKNPQNIVQALDSNSQVGSRMNIQEESQLSPIRSSKKLSKLSLGFQQSPSNRKSNEGQIADISINKYLSRKESNGYGY